MFSKFKIYLIVLVLLGVIGGAAYGYFVWTQGKLEEMAKEVATMRAENEILKLGMTTLRSDAALVKETTERHNAMIGEIRDDAEKQKNALRDQDLTEMGMADSRDLEQRVNRATKARIKSLEDLSRAK